MDDAKPATITVTISNPNGLHLRKQRDGIHSQPLPSPDHAEKPDGRFLRWWMSRASSRSCNCKPAPAMSIRISADGPDAHAALDALRDLLAGRIACLNAYADFLRPHCGAWHRHRRGRGLPPRSGCPAAADDESLSIDPQTEWRRFLDAQAEVDAEFRAACANPNSLVAEIRGPSPGAPRPNPA